MAGTSSSPTASAPLLTLHATEPHASPLTEILVLTVANLVATLIRFVLLRGWVFRSRRIAPDPAAHPGAPAGSETPLELIK